MASGDPVAHVSLFTGGTGTSVMNRDLRAAAEVCGALEDIPYDDRVRMAAEAARIFAEDELPIGVTASDDEMGSLMTTFSEASPV